MWVCCVVFGPCGDAWVGGCGVVVGAVPSVVDGVGELLGVEVDLVDGWFVEGGCGLDAALLGDADDGVSCGCHDHLPQLNQVS